MGTYSYSGKAQVVTVEQSGTYNIVAFGGQGGGYVDAMFNSRGGKGAEIGGNFYLTAGEKLEIIVGGAGKNPGAKDGYGGGGGGSFVLANTGPGGAYKLLIAAGGGGGDLGKVATNGNGSVAPGNGQGGVAGYGGSGAGVKSNGSGSAVILPGYGGMNGSGGYAGGPGAYNDGAGGFGGGGGGGGSVGHQGGGGGGGGYSGGYGGRNGGGGGGGSYDSGIPVADQTVAGENFGNGRVVIAPNVTCFVSGTLIATTRGDVAVERLAVGDVASTADGGRRRIRWIGHRRIACDTQPTPSDVWPVRIAAGAFGIGMPARDLLLSPGHPVLVGADANSEGGHLVPIMCLINGTTVRRVAVETVTYWHVELDAHDILLAEGLPAESYLDWGDRPFFTEGADHALANPDFVVPGLTGRCRPVALDGPVVQAERRRLDSVFATRLVAACDWGGAGAVPGF